jgi:flagellar FliJ protein
MKRFRFPLRPVAVLRAHREQRAQEAFAAAVQAAVKADMELMATRTRVAQFEATLSAGRRETFSALDEAQALAAYRTECAAEALAERRSREAHATSEERRQEYIEAHRKVEVVKRLEDKARTAHRHEVSREEQADFDDFAGRQFAARARKVA